MIGHDYPTHKVVKLPYILSVQKCFDDYIGNRRVSEPGGSGRDLRNADCAGQSPSNEDLDIIGHPVR